jgi:hypothetical protein
MKIYATFRISAIIFALVLFGIDVPWSCLSNLCNNFQFNVIWHKRSVVTVVFGRRLAGSDITVGTIIHMYGLSTLVT